MGRTISVAKTSDGMRAVIKDKVLDPRSVEKYLTQRFGDDLQEVEEGMRELAKAFPSAKLSVVAYSLYEKFRSKVPEGQKSWGVKGELDLNLTRSMVKKLGG